MDLKRVIVKPFNKDKFEVWEEYAFEIGIDFKGEKVQVGGVIPKNYTTDGASIPRIFWSLYPPYKSEYFSACVIHDFLCSRAMHEVSIKEAYKKADLCFYECLKLLGVGKITSFIFYHWVDIFHALKCFFKGWN